ncbi:MAG TPA: type VI secretion system tip protein TssI/VgrG [Gemmatimonadaceae bacterium]|jgi:type VI secretion system secreted protein VgrG
MPTQTEVTPTMLYAQTGRAIMVETTLPPDALLLESFEGEEEIAGGFCYKLGMLGKDPAIASAKMIRTAATVRMTLGDGSLRVINGLISRFGQRGEMQGLTVYEAEIRPWFWFLSLTTDFRTYQNMTIPDIVKAVCKDQGFSDVTPKCIKAHPPHEYRVQYGETHLDFITRLMEEEGIFWFADHDGKKCNLVIADDNSVAKQVVKVRMSTTTQESEDEQVLQSFFVQQEARPGQHSALDYNFETPSTQLLGHTPGGNSAEVMEFPGGYGTRDDATRISRLRHEELVAEQVQAEGSGRCRALKIGAKLELSKHPNRSANAAYLITSVKQSASLGEFRSGGDRELVYSSSFTAIPFDTPYRPPRETELPRAYGYESAVVVGPAGDEIFTDKYGRVRVQFFWDRKGKKDDSSSCWVRVSTVWAGKGWGVINTPRIGQEVLVAFLNGDPEDPIVVGRVYNAEQMPPYALPANKTQSGMKTRSTLGGSPDNFNEIRFEDKKGSEELYIHAEKDKKIVVENDNAESIGHDEAIEVKNNQSLTVGKEQSITIGGNRSLGVGKDERIDVGKSRSTGVGENDRTSVAKDRTHDIGKNEMLTIGEKRTTSIAKDDELTVEENRKTTVGKNDELTVGKKLLISAADEIVIETGDASITMKKNGEITISGKDITLNGSGKINVKASSDVVLKGSKVAAN